MKVRLAYRTDVGKVRERNEDSGCVHTLDSISINVLGVADGMGGHAGGDIASKTAIEVMEKRIGELDEPPDRPLDLIKSIILQANNTICNAAEKEDMDMGTTLTIGLHIGKILYVGHVGDSRVYTIAKNIWKQITEDHSWVAEQVRQNNMTQEEAEASPYRSSLMRYIGTRKHLEISLYRQAVQKKTTYLFCTDGLHGYINDEEIVRYVRKIRNVKRLCRKLIRLANKKGGEDNITVALLRVK